MAEKIDALDLVLNVLKEHEKKLDEISSNFDAIIEKKACEKARQKLLFALDFMEDVEK